MTRDYSHLFPGATPSPAPMSHLTRLGWSGFFASQVEADALSETPPVRVTEVHRSGLIAQGDGPDVELPPNDDLTVGDWLLFDADHPKDSARLDRKSVLKRVAAGRVKYEQLIAANVDTVFIVTSCNADFNVARLERYVALCFEADITPVIVLTKSDLTDPAPFEAEAASISERVSVVALNAKDTSAVHNGLADWSGPGQTIAFLGSSGVGKSTLTNALADVSVDTADIREDDAKGRHTTRHRQLHVTAAGLSIIDTPGMRELQLTDVAGGLSELFDDIETLATQCKFRNCAHEGEPGCAVQTAIEIGDLDKARLDRWRKLAAEEAHNSASIAQKREKDRAFSKHVKRALKAKPNKR